MWAQTEWVSIIEGGTSAGRAQGTKILATISDPSELSDLARLTSIEDGDFGHCLCFGEPALELHAEDGAVVAVLGLHHGEALRWDSWSSDAPLLHGPDLLEWLAPRGVQGPLAEFEEARRDAEAYEAQYRDWTEAIPTPLEGLRPVIDELRQSGGMLNDETLVEFAGRLELSHPDPVEQTRLLLRWFGSGSGKMSGYPSYEGIPEQFLLAIPTKTVIEALNEADLDVLDGGVRYLAGWHFRKERTEDLELIPVSERRTLLTRAEASGDEDKIGRAVRAFA
jgi:hypothetical protein